MAGLISYPRTVGSNQLNRRCYRLESMISQLNGMLTSGSLNDLLTMANLIGWANLPPHIRRRLQELLTQNWQPLWNEQSNHVERMLVRKKTVEFAFALYSQDLDEKTDFSDYMGNTLNVATQSVGKRSVISQPLLVIDDIFVLTDTWSDDEDVRESSQEGTGTAIIVHASQQDADTQTDIIKAYESRRITFLRKRKKTNDLSASTADKNIGKAQKKDESITDAEERRLDRKREKELWEAAKKNSLLGVISRAIDNGNISAVFSAIEELGWNNVPADLLAAFFALLNKPEREALEKTLRAKNEQAHQKQRINTELLNESLIKLKEKLQKQSNELSSSMGATANSISIGALAQQLADLEEVASELTESQVAIRFNLIIANLISCLNHGAHTAQLSGLIEDTINFFESKSATDPKYRVSTGQIVRLYLLLLSLSQRNELKKRWLQKLKYHYQQLPTIVDDYTFDIHYIYNLKHGDRKFLSRVLSAMQLRMAHNNSLRLNLQYELLDVLKKNVVQTTCHQELKNKTAMYLHLLPFEEKLVGAVFKYFLEQHLSS